jgi:hypothetical protein
VLLARTYQCSIINRPRAVFQLAIEKVAKAWVLLQVCRFDLLEVAPEDEGVESEAKGPKPDWELERVEVAPEAGHVAEGERTQDVDLELGSLVVHWTVGGEHMARSRDTPAMVL